MGLLNNGTPIVSTSGAASGSFVDGVAKLRGINTILGRSVIVHGASPDHSAERHAQCVIGLKQIRDPMHPPEPALDDGSSSSETDDAPVRPGPRASCVLQPVETGTTAVSGHVVLAQRLLAPGEPGAGEVSPNGTWITYRDVGPLPGAQAGHHVHAWGDVSAADGSAAGGHFLGACNDSAPCRPSWAAAQEVGMLFNDGFLNGTTTADGWGGQWAVGVAMARDEVVRVLPGRGEEAAATVRGRGVVGRSIVVHAEPAGGAREGQCVIGIADPDRYPSVDCVEGEWSEWGACVCPEGGGSGLAGREERTRPVLTAPVFGGTPCDALSELRPCGPCPRRPRGLAGIVIAIAVGTLVAVGVAVAAWMYYRRRGRPELQHQRLGDDSGTVVVHAPVVDLTPGVAMGRESQSGSVA